MTVWIIIGCILAFLLLLLLAPVRLRVAYRQDTLKIHVRYLLLRFNLSPDALERRAAKKEKRPKKVKPAKQKKKTKEKPEKKKGTEQLREWLAVARSAFPGVRKGLRILRNGMVFDRIRVGIAAAGSDAHQTALLYARLTAAVTTALSVIGSLFVLKSPYIRIQPDFNAGKSRYDLSLRLSIRPLTAIRAAIHIGWAVLQSMKQKDGRKKKHRRQNRRVAVQT